jgi:hypothetical protein
MLLWGIPTHPHSPYSLAIARSKIRLVVSTGDHTERALLHVRTSACHPSKVPMLIPDLGSLGSISLIYDDAAQHRRAFNADFLVDLVSANITHCFQFYGIT